MKKNIKLIKTKKHNFLNFINNKILMELYGKLVFNKLELRWLNWTKVKLKVWILLKLKRHHLRFRIYFIIIILVKA